MDNNYNLKGGKFECNPHNNFDDICIETDKGIYKNKESCINDCETKYINNQLNEINIRHETTKFYLFIKDIIKNEFIDVYIKGGNVIGLKILKMMYDKYKDDDITFKKHFDKFLELDLIKDWDFASYTKKPITPEYRNELNKIAKKYNLVSRATKFILYQTPKPKMLDDKALFEISIVDSDSYSDLEIPLTTMKIRVHEYNIKYIFMFAKLFFSYKLKDEPFDFSILKRILGKITILIHPHEDGLYDVKKIDIGPINYELVDFIEKYKDENNNLPQFFITHLIDTFRLLYRLPEKNIPKTNKIKKFLKDELNIKKVAWLFDSSYIKKMVNKFIKELSIKIVDIYTKNNSMNDVIVFLNGVGFGRSQIDYDMYSTESKHNLFILFDKLVMKIGKDKILSMDDTKNLIKFIKFLINKGLFD